MKTKHDYNLEEFFPIYLYGLKICSLKYLVQCAYTVCCEFIRAGIIERDKESYTKLKSYQTSKVNSVLTAVCRLLEHIAVAPDNV